MTTQESNKHYIILYSIAQIIKQRNTYTTSDDTNHDCVFTFCVVEDIILNHPEVIEVIEQGILVLRSDNCEEQYKNRKTFYIMKLRSITSRSTGFMKLLGMGGG